MYICKNIKYIKNNMNTSISIIIEMIHIKILDAV